MAVHSDPFYGREPVIKFVRKLMAREEVGRSLRNRHFPTLVIEGARGAGKTALLSTLDKLLDQRVPHAMQDFEAVGDASLPQVLSALAFELSEKCHRYGALRFPRLIVGQLVTRLDLDPDDPTEARKQVIEALARRRGVNTIRAMLVEMAGVALKAGGVPGEPPGKVLGLAFEWLAARAPDRIVLGSFQGWYGHRDLGLTNDSIDVLIRLNKWAQHKDDERSRQRVDELLLAAFLADLRIEFNRGRRSDERSLNCVLLFDNADSELGQRFLDQLAHARRQRVESEQGDGDPLTVVATSRGPLLTGVPRTDWEPVTLGSTRGDRPLETTGWSRLGWLRYQLPDLTEVEVERAVTAAMPATVDNQRLARMLFQLTDGHPASIRLVLDAIAMNPDPPEDVIDLKVIMSQPPAGKKPHRRPTVEDQILDRLLKDAAEAEFTSRELVTCTAARELPHALWLSTQEDLGLSGQGKDLLEILEPILWPAGRAAGPGPALPRRLLQRRLARDDPEATPSWAAVYGRLREAPRVDGDMVSELYYALAGGELGLVTRRLHQYLTETEIEDKQWLELLKSVTSAPRRHQHQQTLMDEVLTLVQAAMLEKSLASLAWLIAGLWVAADPFIDSNRGDLHKQIAFDYDAVARLTRKGFSVAFRAEADKHRREATFWGRRN